MVALFDADKALTTASVALVVAVVATLVIHFAFYKLLRVPLPWGLLTPWAW